MKTRICEKCGTIMEEIKVDSPHDVEAFRCPIGKVILPHLWNRIFFYSSDKE